MRWFGAASVWLQHIGERTKAGYLLQFIFLLLSVFATTIAELILSSLNMRGKELLHGIQTLLSDESVTGLVQKVSNLIINMNIYLHDVHTGKPIAAMSADMRGNTDESWTRTMEWLIRNRMLAPNYGAPQAQ